MDPLIPDHFTTDQKLEFYYAYRMRALNKALQRYFNSIGLTDNIFPAIAYYNSLREVILQRTAPDLKLQSIAQSETSKAKSRAKPASPVKERNQPAVSKPSDASKNTRSSQPSLNGNTPSLPPPQSSFFKSAPSLPPPQSSPAKASPSPAPSQPPQPSLPKFNPTPSSQSLAPSPSASKGKRKGEDFTKDDFEASEASSPLKRAKMQSSTGSNTSNLFKNALNSPAKPLPAQGALEKAAAATPEKPKVNPFAKLPGTSSPAKPGPPPAFSFGAASTTPKASPAKAAAAPSFSFGTESTTPKASPAKPMFSGFPTPAAAAPASAPKAATGGSSNFLAQFGAKAKDDEAANEKKLMQRAMDEDYDSDDDKEEWIANYKKKRAEELNALKAIKDKPTSAIPSVSGSVNFLSQFGAKAKDDEAANEKKLMQRAMDEDYDSDDDKEEWIANYKKKRAEELKALEEAKKTATGFSLKPKSGSSESKPAGGFVFKPSSDTSSEKSKSSGFVFKPTESSSSQAAKETSTKSSPFPSVAQPKPLLGQSATAKSSGSSVFESLNSTRAPTPTFSFGAPVPDTQTTAPVFEGLFGHLSKQNSEEGSNKENSDEDDDGHESDSENKDPNYDPKKDKNPDSPSTPVEETGAGIASTKKATNPFSFGSSTPTPAAKTGSLFGTPSNSGTTTPKPSLFDRITRDSNGQPVKDTSEEKENTKPAPTNLFGSLNKAPGSPADQTWKPDTPIKFGGNGASTDENSSLKPANPFGSLFGTAPAVTVQAATPTKPAAPFGNLFGTSKPATANGSGTSTPSLFAGLNAPKPGASTVGFGFGAASGSSSLFPSAAASTTTSRATTPGGTTDGDSAAENADPDAEKHAQLDLSEQAPGEEDEKRLFEIHEVYLPCTLRDKRMCKKHTTEANEKFGGMGGAWDMALHSDIEYK
ncbi:hypothetical protein M7I_3811 [Glarea lozoyensis 74030]|uniref:Uncharacterized protein n=1 Tax=Glarea lozoyensis (strain ATCC 74030 / MF5533) TaxID=1104152 RepID=H0EMH4_GLAL7|nr:hypothetical protein M7I_3811 [Glarea lozoyensis 74030]